MGCAVASYAVLVDGVPERLVCCAGASVLHASTDASPCATPDVTSVHALVHQPEACPDVVVLLQLLRTAVQLP